jgi:hypothetical protein
MLFLPWLGKAGFGRRSVSRSWLVLFIYGALALSYMELWRYRARRAWPRCRLSRSRSELAEIAASGSRPSFDRCCDEMTMPDAGNRVIHFESIGLADHSQLHLRFLILFVGDDVTISITPIPDRSRFAQLDSIGDQEEFRSVIQFRSVDQQRHRRFQNRRGFRIHKRIFRNEKDF